MSEDSPIVEEVRRRAGEISRRHGDDLRRYTEHLKEVQAENPERVVEQITVVPAERSKSPSPGAK
ncbi:MAG: hypothetical protein HZB38_02270 [Planctomycetes bacterium]|nr:hypothetical protein [Planctomycetota bacterium]